MPKRIQRKRTKGWRMPPNTVYVGRGSKWGNQFFVDPEHTLDKHDPPKLIGAIFACRTAREAIRKYEQTNIDSKIRLYFSKENIKNELKGKNLACWCPLDRPCHTDILLKIANAPRKRK